MVIRVSACPLMMIAVLSACSDQTMPERSIGNGNLPTPDSEDRQAAKSLAIGSQTNLIADLTPEAKAQRCAPAVNWLTERMRAAGVLSQQQLAALAVARRNFQDQASMGRRAEDAEVEADTTISPSETLQTAIECLRHLPTAK